MQIAIDAREALGSNPTGKGLFAKRIIEELRKRSELDLVIFPQEKNEIRLPTDLSPVARAEEEAEAKTGKTKGLFWHVITARRIKKIKPDLYLSPTSFIIPALIGHTIPTGIVIHDLIAFDNEPHNRKAKWIERLTLPRALRTAKHIFTVSQATTDELLKRFPHVDKSKIVITYEGPTVKTMGDELLAMSSSQLPAPRSKPYILTVGTLCPRKNQLRLIQAFNALPDDIKRDTRLILAGGRGWQEQEIVDLAKQSPQVEWRGYVSDDELTTLLQQATMLAYPSLKEGFGLPVLDAMTLGIPILTSDRSSMAEIAGDAALLMDPESADAIRDGLERMLTDDALRNDLIAKGKERAKMFSWKRTTNIMMEVFKNKLKTSN